jgi:hypothetical protein
LIQKEAGNFDLPAFPGCIVKESYWCWPQRNLAGDTIDFFAQVLGMSFHNAMRQITGTKPLTSATLGSRPATKPLGTWSAAAISEVLNPSPTDSQGQFCNSRD